MNIKQLSTVSLMLMALSSQVIAAQTIASTELDREREQVIREYILDLERGDHEGIGKLFEDDGYVISTSRGTANAKEFFASFLPLIASASTEYHQGFVNSIDENRFAARFHYEYILKDGELGNGEYVDEFTFANNSAKLKSVFMFENLHFK